MVNVYILILLLLRDSQGSKSYKISMSQFKVIDAKTEKQKDGGNQIFTRLVSKYNFDQCKI